MRKLIQAVLATALVVFIAVRLSGCGADPITQKASIGTRCMSSDDCGTNPPFFCATDHPGGYCKKDCKSDSDCPSEAICAFDGAVGACHLKCNNNADCRINEGYKCIPASMNLSTLAMHAYCDAVEAMGVDAGTPMPDMSKAVPTDGATGG